MQHLTSIYPKTHSWGVSFLSKIAKCMIIVLSNITATNIFFDHWLHFTFTFSRYTINNLFKYYLKFHKKCSWHFPSRNLNLNSHRIPILLHKQPENYLYCLIHLFNHVLEMVILDRPKFQYLFNISLFFSTYLLCNQIEAAF